MNRLSALALVALLPAAALAQPAPAPAPGADAELVAPARPAAPAPVETEAERRARIVREELSVLDREVLNRVTLPLFGEPNHVRAERRVRAREVAEYRARAEALLAPLKDSDPALWRRLRAQHHDTMVRLYRELRGE